MTAAGIRNPGTPLQRDLIEDIVVNRSAAEHRAVLHLRVL